MIGKISGRLEYRGADHVLIDVNGVGYIVYCSQPTLALMPVPGGRVALYTDLLVREDNLQLFGFPTLADKEWHRLLTGVQGVGAKVALAISGTLGADGVARAISLGDAAAIKAAPGVGPKLAQRVVIELKDKAPSVIAMGAAGAVETMQADREVVASSVIDSVAPDPAESSGSGAGSPSSGLAQAAKSGAAAARAEALSALVNLGYGQGEAASAIAEATAASEAPNTQTLIRACLRLLAPKG